MCLSCHSLSFNMADTHRILALSTLEILGTQEDMRAPTGARMSGWCGVRASLQTSLRLETNPTRIPQVLLPPRVATALSSTLHSPPLTLHQPPDFLRLARGQ